MEHIQRFRAYMRNKGISLSLFFNFESLKPTANYRYMSGFLGQGVLAISQRGRPVLFVPEPEYPIAKKEVRDCEIINYKRPLKDAIRKRFPKQSRGRVGLDLVYLRAMQLYRLKKNLGLKSTVDVGEEVRKLRRIKSSQEISDVRKACDYTSKILNKALGRFREFRTESDVSSFLVKETYREGLKLSFEPIVAAGRNSGKWHHVTSTDRITRGFVIIDFGCRYNGYCADVTRTVFKGKPTKEETLEYNRLLTVQQDCMSMVRHGMDYRKIHEYAAKKLGKHFNHGIGHGIGLEEHESPFVHEAKLAKGMLLTIEPGIYHPYRFGIRIEDDVLVKEDGHEILSRIDKKLKII